MRLRLKDRLRNKLILVNVKKPIDYYNLIGYNICIY